MSTLELKELSAPAGQVIKIAAGKTLDLKSQGSVTMPTGSVLQVVNTSSQAQLITTSTAWVATSLVATITPTSTSSKILIVFNMPAYQASAGSHEAATLFRGTVSGTNLGDSSWGFGSVHSSSGAILATLSGNYLDSPSTTSAQTYTVAHRVNGGTGYAMINVAFGGITLMEISG